MELETEGLENDSVLKAESPQPFTLAKLPEHQQPGLYPSPFTLLQPTLGRKIKDSCVESIQPKEKTNLKALVFGAPQGKCPVSSGLSYSRVQQLTSPALTHKASNSQGMDPKDHQSWNESL